MPQIRYKETDRISVIEREFNRYGIKTESAQDEMTVYHNDMLEKEYEFNVKGAQGVSDHRIAMALSLIGIRSGNTTIKEADSIAISYPNYLDHIEQLGVKYTEKKIRNEITPNLAM